VVLETIDVAPYTYVRLDAGGKEVWIAGPQTGVQVGGRVSMAGGFPMANFYSPTLRRTFEVIYFTSALEVEDAGAGGAAATRPPTHAGPGEARPGTPDPGVPSAEVPSPGAQKLRAPQPDAPQPDAPPPDASAICTPEGGATIAQIHDGRSELDGNEVLVRGLVVSFQPQIMGRNWVHIRDGSDGDAGADLTLTTQDMATVGSAVLVRGVLNVDRDFGHGYRYDVIVEDAAVSPEKSPCPEKP
jgi:hypothetical protein